MNLAIENQKKEATKCGFPDKNIQLIKKLRAAVPHRPKEIWF